MPNSLLDLTSSISLVFIAEGNCSGVFQLFKNFKLFIQDSL